MAWAHDRSRDRSSAVIRRSLPQHHAQPDQEQNRADQDWPPRPRRARNPKKQRRDAKDNRNDRQPVPNHAILNSSQGAVDVGSSMRPSHGAVTRASQQMPPDAFLTRCKVGRPRPNPAGFLTAFNRRFRGPCRDCHESPRPDPAELGHHADACHPLSDAGPADRVVSGYCAYCPRGVAIRRLAPTRATGR